jgi:release factor glutamine methyltransferase
MASVGELLRAGASLPGEAAQRDAEILLGHVLQQGRTWLYTWPEREVTADSEARYRQLLEARAGGEPVAYLTGEREFWSLSLRVTPDTLIPRIETETLVEWALALDLPAAAAVADLGTGSGAIALALASERPQWCVTGSDFSAAALDVARANAQRLKLQVHWCESNWLQAFDGQRFDLVVSNPPYIATGDSHLSRGDLRFEPATALSSGSDGLRDIRELVRRAPDYLRSGGWLLLEHGYDQGAAVRELLKVAGYECIETRCDLAGHDRITGGCRAH